MAASRYLLPIFIACLLISCSQQKNTYTIHLISDSCKFNGIITIDKIKKIPFQGSPIFGNFFQYDVTLLARKNVNILITEKNNKSSIFYDIENDGKVYFSGEIKPSKKWAIAKIYLGNLPKSKRLKRETRLIVKRANINYKQKCKLSPSKSKEEFVFNIAKKG